VTIRFVLASASPARRETLLRAGVVPEVIVSGVDESAITADTPAALVQELANAKASVVSQQLRGEVLVLGCDSLLEFDGLAVGKPGTIEAAVAQWRRMRGRVGTLHTGHCLIDHAAGRVALATLSTVVEFADITDDEIEIYCRSGEPSNVAGAFTIDGFGGWFVNGVTGDHHNVVGLSLPLLRRLLGELNFTLPDIGYPTP
jgi:nucleoside triphosphate pyrophosphatase